MAAEKFLVDRNGRTVKRFKSAFDPQEFEGDVRLLLVGGRLLRACSWATTLVEVRGVVCGVCTSVLAWLWDLYDY